MDSEVVRQRINGESAKRVERARMIVNRFGEFYRVSRPKSSDGTCLRKKEGNWENGSHSSA